MFPIRDSTPRQHFPFVNYSIILVTILVFIRQLTVPDFEVFVQQYSFVPNQFHVFNLASYRQMITSIFLHGSIFHILSNMWFLHIFGDNVEDKLGHFRYFLFYLFAGFVAVFSQLFFTLGSDIPMLGASGAISGVAGAYFVFFRRSTVETLIFLLFLWIIKIPAWLFLGYWFVIQIFNGVGSLVAFDINQGGIAYFAHVGGFVYGYLIAKSFYNKIKLREMV